MSKSHRIVFIVLVFITGCAKSFWHDFSSYQKSEFTKNKKIIASAWVFKSEKDQRHFEQMSLLWQLSTPYLYKEHVYFGLADGHFYKLNRKTGSLVWKIKLGESIQSDVVIHDDVAYFGDLEGKIYAVEVGHGTLLWTYNAGASFISRALVMENEIALVLSNEALIFLDKRTGKFAGNYERRFEKTGIFGNAVPIYDNGKLYVGFSDGTFISLLVAERRIIWERALGSDATFSDIDVRAVIDGNKIYVMTYGGDLYALDKEEGTIQWKAKEVGGVAHMLLADDHLYVSTTNGKLYVISTHDGVAQFVYNNQKEGEIYTGPVRIRDYIIVGGSRTGVYAFTPNLQLIDTYRVGSGIIGELATDANNAVYFTSNYAHVYSLKVP